MPSVIKKERSFLYTPQMSFSNIKPDAEEFMVSGMCKNETLSQPQTDSHVSANWMLWSGFC